MREKKNKKKKQHDVTTSKIVHKIETKGKIGVLGNVL